MRTAKLNSWLLIPLLLAGCATATAEPALPTGEEAARLRAETQRVLFWSQEEKDRNFPRMHELFPARLVEAGGEARPLPAGEPLAPALGGDAGVAALMDSMNAAGLLVLQDGRIRLERYARGFGPDKLWTSFSVAKSLTSTLVGAAVRDGHIASLDDPVTRYIPELKGSGYDGVSVRHVLTMTSGVRWNEDYTDPNSDVARMFTAPRAKGEDVTIAYLKTLGREAEPGTKWAYKTGESNLIGVLVSRATGKPLARYLSETLWRPYMADDAWWQIDEGGQEIGGCCLSASLRDYGRIGQFILDGGRAGGREVLPAGWIADATRAQAEIGAPGRGYGYQWWAGPYGTFSAIGIFGQMVHVDPKRNLVIVTAGAAPSATSRELSAARSALVTRITAAAE